MSTKRKSVKEQITVNELIILKENGLSYREIGDIFGVSKQRIHNIIKKYYDNNYYVEINEQIISKIKQDIASSGLSLKKYSLNTGISYYILRSILSNQVATVKYDNIKRIANTLKISVNKIIKNDLRFLQSHKKVDYTIYKMISNNLSVQKNSLLIDSSIAISEDTINLIKAYRLSNKLSNNDFAKKIGISASRMSQIEHYKVLSVRYSTLKKIARTLNISIEQLLIPDDSINIKVNFDDFKIKINRNIAKKIRLERKRMKLTQDELGGIIGWNKDLISRLELGTLKAIKKSILKDICNALSIDVNIDCYTA